MRTHNPKRVIEDLQVILSNPNKKIGFLLGAGISMKDKDNKDFIPGISKMTTDVVGKFPDDPEKSAIVAIKEEIESEGGKFNIESLLSKISEKERAAGNEKLCGLNKSDLHGLRGKIEKEVEEIVAVHKKPDFLTRNLNHTDFARWIKNADRESPVEIFTTNYDYLFELALEKEQIPYFDGFIGSYHAFFCPDWIEDDSAVKDWVKLWKLHGSLGWKIENHEIIRDGKDSAMIYPSFLKYDHSRKQPYLSYMDRLSFFLRQEDAVLFVCGYSFGDEHINEVILTALGRSRSSCVFVLKAGELKKEDDLSEKIARKSSKISIYAKRTAIIGSNFGEWKLTSKEDLLPSFKEDKLKTDEDWDGSGDLLLGDFSEFTKFLSNFYTIHKP